MDWSGAFDLHVGVRDGEIDTVPATFPLDLTIPPMIPGDGVRYSRSVSPDREFGDFDDILLDESAPAFAMNNFTRSSDNSQHEPTLAALLESDRESPIVDEEMQRIFQQLSSSFGSVSSVSTDCSLGHFPAERSLSSSLPLNREKPHSADASAGYEYGVSLPVPMSPAAREHTHMDHANGCFDFPNLVHRQNWQEATAEKRSVQTLMAGSKPVHPSQSPHPRTCPDPATLQPRAFASDELAKSVAALAKLSTSCPARSGEPLVLDLFSATARSFPDSSVCPSSQESPCMSEIGRSEVLSCSWRSKNSANQPRGPQGSDKASLVSGDVDGGSITDDLLEDSSDDSDNDMSSAGGYVRGQRKRPRRSFSTDPSPARLLSIDTDIDRLSSAASVVLGDETSPGRRREKNKIASRVCRLRKKYHFEAIKVLQRGLEMEADQLKDLTIKVREEILRGGGSFSAKAKSLEEHIWTHKVSGRSEAFIGDVLSEARRGNWNGGLTGRVLLK